MYTLLGTAFHLQLSKIFKPTLMEKKYLINPISNHLVPPHHNPNQNKPIAKAACRIFRSLQYEIIFQTSQLS